mmetsp:Transcript_5794/g.7272  ORF Transcript_5794/g.7272 Transcript_5794/m.7272 type:complete len:229 (-) Transcript_5794:268-954(-)
MHMKTSVACLILGLCSFLGTPFCLALTQSYHGRFQLNQERAKILKNTQFEMILGISKKSKVSVRQATKKDFEAIAETRNAINPYSTSGGTGFLGSKVKVDPEEAKKRMLNAKIGSLLSGEFVCYIAEQNQSIVGSVDLSKQNSQGLEYVFVKNMQVSPEKRRKGIATKLLDEASNHCKREGAGVLCLDVDVSNIAARSLYEKYGFKKASSNILESIGIGRIKMFKPII